ncbi:hypothetical protein V044_02746, partial [Staphylococcus aureus S56_POEL]
MVNKKTVVKEVMKQTPIGIKFRLLKIGLILFCVLFFLFPVILMFVFSPEE